MELQLGELGYTLDEVEPLKSRVKTHLYLMYETYKGTEKPHVNVHEDGDDGVDLGDDDDIDDDDVELRIERRLNRQRKEAKLKEIANEVDKYFNDAYESTKNDDFDLLGWWKSKISSYSILSKVAKDVLAFPSSTVASENAFSLGGRIVDPFRASLTSRMVEALVCTNDWLRGEEFQFYKETTEEDLEFYMELEQLEQSIPNTNEMPPPPSKTKSANPPESGVNKLSSHPSRGGKGGRGRSNRGGRGGGATSSSKLIDEE
ncbi:Zinc finger BED domain-containing protein DAYSLEEPER [Striga hermonthica]|uniref:Zinc finger BED domain-containing protein DAYSLEEPER n=1 Tax=Striga hermonthica TaxID=68872 RepID=A0A9N7N7M5_STRHE|nr:Zinc finger BED domain-containing protein DAYSLEEPER [Striga hermonthica]